MTRTLLCILLTGCQPLPVTNVPESSNDTATPDDTATPSDTGDTDDTGDTNDTNDTDDTDDTDDTGKKPEPVDCSKLPEAPISIEPVPGARGYHGLAFDDDGHIIGSDNASLIKSTRAGDWDVLTPSISDTEQIERLDSGDLAVLSGTTVKRVTMEGASSMLSSEVGYSYGITVGPDGMLYVANYTTILRIDPDTGEQTNLLGNVGSTSPKVVNFSPDHSTMYYGSLSGGKVYAVPLDENLNPTGLPEVFASSVGEWNDGWHDGLGVDVCGNLYVAEYWTSALYKITPDGTVSMYHRFSDVAYGHGLTWGSGIGGFLEDALYVPQPYNNNSVQELVIGVPMRGWDGEVLNGPE